MSAEQPNRREQPAQQQAAQSHTAESLAHVDGEAKNLAELLLQSNSPKDVQQIFGGEINQDHVLGNLNEDEIWERRHNIHNQREFAEAMFPPEESVLQGEVRERFGLDGPKHPLTPQNEHFLSDTADAALARSTRARDGFERKMMNKSISEVHRVDESNRGDESSGILGGLIGGGGR